MAHRIEVAPSGRASCRGCKEKIAKGDLRFCEEYTSAFSDGEAYRYWHMLCAAPKLPVQVRQAMDAYTGDIPNKADIEAAMVAGAKKGGKGGAKLPFPHADVAPTGVGLNAHVRGSKLNRENGVDGTPVPSSAA